MPLHGHQPGLGGDRGAAGGSPVAVSASLTFLDRAKGVQGPGAGCSPLTHTRGAAVLEGSVGARGGRASASRHPPGHVGTKPPWQRPGEGSGALGTTGWGRHEWCFGAGGAFVGLFGRSCPPRVAELWFFGCPRAG